MLVAFRFVIFAIKLSIFFCLSVTRAQWSNTATHPLLVSGSVLTACYTVYVPWSIAVSGCYTCFTVPLWPSNKRRSEWRCTGLEKPLKHQFDKLAHSTGGKQTPEQLTVAQGNKNRGHTKCRTVYFSGILGAKLSVCWKWRLGLEHDGEKVRNRAALFILCRDCRTSGEKDVSMTPRGGKAVTAAWCRTHSCARPVEDQAQWVTLGCAISGPKKMWWVHGADTIWCL